MSAPAQAASPKVLADMPVRLIVEDVVMPPNMPLVRIPVREEVTRVIVSEKDETKPAASASYPYTRPLPPTEGGRPMADDHKKDDHKPHGTGGSDTLKKAWGWTLLAIVVLLVAIGVERYIKGLPMYGSASVDTRGGGYARTHEPSGSVPVRRTKTGQQYCDEQAPGTVFVEWIGRGPDRHARCAY